MLALGIDTETGPHKEAIERVVERARALLARVDDCTFDSPKSAQESFVANCTAVTAEAISTVADVEWLIDACGPAAHDSETTRDVLYFTGLELRATHRPLRRLSVASEEAATHCARALGTVVRTMVTVERQICEVFGGEPQLGWALEPGVALETRQAYSAFRNAIVPWGRFDGRVNADLVRTRLDLGRTAIAALEKSHVWPRFRMADRLEFLRLEERIVRWSARPVVLAREGASIWDDLVAFAELLEGINMRQELREFDRWIASELLPFLDECTPDEEVPPVVYDLGAELRWRSGEWERLFASNSPVKEWREALELLAEG